MRVVLSILDAMPTGVLGPVETPHLWAQVEAGGRAPLGGLSLPVSVTYSNHAAFVTGADPSETGLWGNKAWVDGEFIKTWDAGPRATTLFDRCAAAGRTSMAIVGDHKLGITMGTGAADHAWPPSAEVPPGTAVDLFGYPADSAVIEAASMADLAAADFLLLHLNEPDTTMHVHGPTSDAARAQYRASDASYGQLIELLQPGWDDTVLITISDHEQEDITDPACVDLRAALADHDVAVAHDGTGAIVVGAIDVAHIIAVDGVGGAEVDPVDTNVTIVWTDPGRMFGRGDTLARGNHGSPRCRAQVAIASGGHPQAQAIARQIEQVRPGTLTWAPMIAQLLGLP